MFWSIIKSLCFVLVTPILALITKQILCYLKLSKYRSQGIRCFFYPIMGIRRSVRGRVILKDIRKRVEEKVNGDQLIAGNSLMSTEPQLLITGSKLFREFLLVENENFVRTGSTEKVYQNKSFFFENGKKAMKYRGIYTGFFKAENINKIIPQIETIFEDSFKKVAVKLFNSKVELNSSGQLLLKDGVQKEDLGWKNIDFQPFLKEPFDKMINVVLFGSKSKEDSPKFEGGKLFSEAIREFIFLKFRAFINIPNLLSGGLINDWKLSPISRKVDVEEKKMFKMMKEFFDNRMKSGKYDGVNLLDLTIRHNQRCLDQGNKEDLLDDERIVDFMRTFYFGGYDTSKSTSGFALFNLSYYPEMREKFLKDVDMLNKQDPEKRDYDSAEYMSRFIKENLRLLGPFQSTLPRYCTKTCKIGGYKIHKGSFVCVRMDLFHTDPAIYNKPFDLNPERFADKKTVDKATRNLSNIPFYTGRRSCIGQYLGEMLIKIVLRTALTVFEVQWDGKSQREFSMAGPMAPRHINISLKPRI